MKNQSDLSLQDSQLVKYSSYINGNWHRSASDISVTNPAVGRESSKYGLDDYLEIKYLSMGCLDK
jgi:hypothetical protein